MEETSEALGMMEVESSMEERQQKTAGSVETTEKASRRAVRSGEERARYLTREVAGKSSMEEQRGWQADSQGEECGRVRAGRRD